MVLAREAAGQDAVMQTLSYGMDILGGSDQHERSVQFGIVR